MSTTAGPAAVSPVHEARAVCAHAKRIVVKIGSRVLVGDGRSVIDREVFPGLVHGIAQAAKEPERRVVLVSSGAVALGRRRLRGRGEGSSLARLQALAALGQSALMQLYEHEFAFHDLLVGQVLLTQADVDDRTRFINARHTLRMLSEELGAVPIINENDTVANEEIRLGDNDRLAALVASLIDAELLLILSDVAGVYTADPTKDPTATVIPEIAADDERLSQLVWRSPVGPGRGGMATKIEAARVAAKVGVATVIAPGREPGIIRRVLAGERVGTLLQPSVSIGARRLWLMHGVAAAGRLHIDEGATRALRQEGRSLLPRGIKAVEGRFEEGAAVDIVGADGTVLARGLAAYGSAEITRIAGRHSAEIPEILGFKRLDAVVHRDDLVLLREH
jgi:glutamate 5-kinase